MEDAVVDEKGRITIPIDYRNQLGLESGVKVAFSVINNMLIIRKVINITEFEHITDEITQYLQNANSSPLVLEKLF